MRVPPPRHLNRPVDRCGEGAEALGGEEGGRRLAGLPQLPVPLAERVGGVRGPSPAAAPNSSPARMGSPAFTGVETTTICSSCAHQWHAPNVDLQWGTATATAASMSGLPATAASATQRRIPESVVQMA